MKGIALLWLAASGATNLAAGSDFRLGLDYSARIGFGAPDPFLNPMLATDGAGAVYVLDTGEPGMLPATAVLGSPGRPASYVMKLSPAGDRMVYLTVLGFRAGAIAADTSGNVYVTGPGLIAKLNATGTAFVYQLSISTDLELDGLAVDNSGRAYIAGHTFAGDLTTTPNAFQRTAPSDYRANAFVARVHPARAAFDYATYLAGTGWDVPTGIAVDGSGTAFVTGRTTSTDFPITAGAYSGDRGSHIDVMLPFLTRLSPDGSKLIYSTITGEVGEEVLAMAVDSEGNAVALQQTVQDLTRLLRFNPQGTTFTFTKTLPFSSFHPRPVRALLDAAGNTYLTGFSSGANYPVKNSLLSCGSFYLTVFGPSDDLLQSTYLAGGSGAPRLPNALALGPNSTVYAVGPADGAFTPTREIGGMKGPLVLTRLSPNGTAQTVKLACMGNAASHDPGPVAPGEIVSLFGEGLGPAQGIQPTADLTSGFPTALANVRVTFDNTPAPLLYVQDAQINAIAPWSLGEGRTTEVCAFLNGVKTNCLSRPVATASRGVFTVDGRYAAAVNQDGTVNSAANPAPWGSAVSIFATGLGPISPPPSDGAIVGLPLPVNVLPAQIAWLGGSVIANYVYRMDPLYAGPAPFQVSGVSQINLSAGWGPMFLLVGPEFPKAWSRPFRIHIR